MDSRFVTRVLVATLLGVVAGLVCFFSGMTVLGLPFTNQDFWLILAHRTVLGFVIGIAAVPGKWWVRGPLLGMIVGIPLTLADQFTYGSPVVTLAVTGMSFLYGLVIDGVLTLGLKERKKA